MVGDMDAQAAPALLLGRYRIEGLLGEGGLGTVVRAFDTRLKRVVAIKTVRRGARADVRSQFRALKEQGALQRHLATVLALRCHR